MGDPIKSYREMFPGPHDSEMGSDIPLGDPSPHRITAPAVNNVQAEASKPRREITAFERANSTMDGSDF
jgi:hypothetical protein